MKQEINFNNEAEELVAIMTDELKTPDERIAAAGKYGDLCGQLLADKKLKAEEIGVFLPPPFDCSAERANSLEEITNDENAVVSERIEAAKSLGEIYGYLLDSITLQGVTVTNRAGRIGAADAKPVIPDET